MEKKTVRIIAKSNKYKKYTFPAMAKYDDRIANYLTGQHKTIDNPDGLTKEEMTMPYNELPAKKKKIYEFVINPDVPHHIKHMRLLDVTTDENGVPINPKDYWDLEFFKLVPQVAPDLKSFKPGGEHIFYIEDEHKEAEDLVSNKRLVYKAMDKIMTKSSVQNYKEIALLLSYYIPNYVINTSTNSALMIEKALLEACEKHPEKVLECFTKPAQEILYVLKLKDNGIISYRAGSYFDGDMFLGNEPTEVIRFSKTKEGAAFHGKWAKMLGKIEGKVDPVPEDKLEE